MSQLYKWPSITQFHTIRGICWFNVYYLQIGCFNGFTVTIFFTHICRISMRIHESERGLPWHNFKADVFWHTINSSKNMTWDSGTRSLKFHIKQICQSIFYGWDKKTQVYTWVFDLYNTTECWASFDVKSWHGRQNFWCGPTQASLWKAPVRWHKGSICLDWIDVFLKNRS